MAVEATEATFQDDVLDSKARSSSTSGRNGAARATPSPRCSTGSPTSTHVKLVKVNVDHEQGLAQRYGVSSIPLMVLFENGEPQARRSARCRRARSSARSA